MKTVSEEESRFLSRMSHENVPKETMTTDVMPRTRWSRQDCFRLGTLHGRGFLPRDIASDPLIDSTEAMVRKMVNRMGGAFGDVPRGNLMVDIGGRLSALAEYGRVRGEAPETLASRVLRILADDPVLLTNVLDDEG